MSQYWEQMKRSATKTKLKGEKLMIERELEAEKKLAQLTSNIHQENINSLQKQLKDLMMKDNTTFASPNAKVGTQQSVTINASTVDLKSLSSVGEFRFSPTKTDSPVSNN